MTTALEVDVAVVLRADITLTAYEGLAGEPLDLAVSPEEAASTITASADVLGVSTVAVPWLSVGHRSGALRTLGSGAGLTAGQYLGELHLTRAGMTGALWVPVTLAVQPGAIAPAARSLTVDRATLPSALSGTLAVGFRPGLAPAWTASADRPWLHATAPGTPGDGELSYTVDEAALASVPNWVTTTATLTVQPAGMAPVTSTFTLHKQLPEIVAAATPLVSNHATDVWVYGRGLSQLTSAGDLLVDGVGGLPGAIVSDREARLQALSLAAGRHVVSVANALADATRPATVDAHAPNAMPSGSVDHAGSVRSVVVDPSRGQVLVSKAGKLLRLRIVDGTWQLDERSVADLADLVLTRDGGTLYAVTGSISSFEPFPLHVMDPSDLTTLASYVPPDTILGSRASAERTTARPSPPTTACGSRPRTSPPRSTSIRLRGLSRSTVRPQRVGPVLRCDVHGIGGRLAPARDVHDGGLEQRIFTDAKPWSYTPAADRFVREQASPPQLRATQLHRASLSADGARALVLEALYAVDGWTLLGRATLSNVLAGRATELSPDGRRVYRAVHAVDPGLATNGQLLRIDVYDADAVTAGTTDLVKLGEIAVTAMVSSCGTSSSSAGDCAAATKLRVSPLGDALVVAGDRKLMVVQVPAALSGVGSP